MHLPRSAFTAANAKGERELAFFTCDAPAGTTLAEMVRVAGARWAIEECFQAAKNETGLDHHQVRRYDASYRHTTLSMLTLAFLQISRYISDCPVLLGALSSSLWQRGWTASAAAAWCS